MLACRSCRDGSVQELIDFGSLPVSSHFLKEKTAAEFKHPFVLGLCSACGMVQQMKPFPAEKLKPLQGWVKYGEPEEHLDDVAEKIRGWAGDSHLKICGLSYKDASFLQRLRAKGFSSTLLLDAQEDLSLPDGYGGVDAVQKALTAEVAGEIVSRRGSFDLIIARHILEHVYDFPHFFQALRSLLTPQGIILFEVPDYAKLFDRQEYSALWEEHIVYFTPATYQAFFPRHSCSLLNFFHYENPLEDCLVALVRPLSSGVESPVASSAESAFTEAVLEKERKRATIFADTFSLQKQIAVNSLASRQHGGKRNVLFGAGHNSCFLINLFGLAPYVEAVIDDNSQKIGLFMPGSQLPIISSAGILRYDVCGLCINPTLEEKVMAEKQDFLKKGGEFISFSPVSPLSVFRNASLRQSTLEVLHAPESIVALGKSDLSVIRENAQKSSRLRSRICVHKSSTDILQEMLLTLRRGTYVRPHKHLRKAESFHIIQGAGYIVIFDDDGGIHKVIPLGDYASGDPFYYRLDEARFHMVMLTSEELLFHETTIGPFVKEETIFAPWSPADDDLEGQKGFLADVLGRIRGMEQQAKGEREEL